MKISCTSTFVFDSRSPHQAKCCSLFSPLYEHNLNPEDIRLSNESLLMLRLGCDIAEPRPDVSPHAQNKSPNRSNDPMRASRRVVAAFLAIVAIVFGACRIIRGPDHSLPASRRPRQQSPTGLHQDHGRGAHRALLLRIPQSTEQQHRPLNYQILGPAGGPASSSAVPPRIPTSAVQPPTMTPAPPISRPSSGTSPATSNTPPTPSASSTPTATTSRATPTPTPPPGRMGLRKMAPRR